MRATGIGLLTVVGIWAVGCGSASDDGLTQGVGGSGASAAAGGSLSGGTGGTLAGGAGGSGGSLSGGSGGSLGGSGGSLNPDAGCAKGTAAATLEPAVLEFVIDTSGSMRDRAPGSNQTKWVVTRDALVQAFNGMPETAAAGIFYYPGGEPPPCIRRQQAVPIALLTPPQKQAIQSSLNSTSVAGGTPTHDAYLFGLETVNQSSLPGNKFIVLITDGIPTYALNCQGNGSTPVSQASNDALVGQVRNAAQAGLRTFVVGVPGSEGARNTLSRMATEGGTALPGCSDSGPSYCHFDMTTQPDLAQALNAALAAISGQALSCEFDIPPPPSGEQLDPNRVNVTYTPTGGATEEIGRDPSTDQCNVGWQYSPDRTRILLCGQLCDRVTADPGGKIEIVFGCATKVE